MSQSIYNTDERDPLLTYAKGLSDDGVTSEMILSTYSRAVRDALFTYLATFQAAGIEANNLIQPDVVEINSAHTTTGNELLLVDTTSNQVDIDVPFTTNIQFRIVDQQKEFDAHDCVLNFKDSLGATRATYAIGTRDTSWTCYKDANTGFWWVGRDGKGEAQGPF